MRTSNDKYSRPFAVVTGASSGIGLELARQFAQHNFDLLIASNSEDIFNAQNELKDYGVDVEALQVNLATFAGVENLCDALHDSDRPVDALAINAGVGVGGEFLSTDFREEINMINLNVISVAHLTKEILPGMCQRGEGRILYTSSIVADMPSPYQAVYGATKAFVSSFAEAIRSEIKDTGVTVTILMPGATDTNFFHRAHLDDTKVGTTGKYENDPADVARQGFEALMEGRKRVLSATFKTKIQGFANKFLPESAKAMFLKKETQPGSALH